MIKAWRELSAGLRSRHPCVLGTALTLFLMACALIECAGRAGWYAHIPERLLLRHSADLFTHIAHTLAELRQSRPPVAVYFVGGSAMAYAVEPASFQTGMTELGGQSPAVHNFGIGRQPMGEALSIVDNLPSGAGIVVLGVNPRVLSRPLASFFDRWRHRHLPLYSSALNDFLAREGSSELAVDALLPSIIWRLKHQLWFRGIRLVRGGEPIEDFIAPWYTREPLPAEKKSRKIREYVARCRENFDRDFPVNLRAVVALVVAARERGLSVVLLELPMNPEARSQFGEEFLAHYGGQVDLLARGLGVPYWEPGRRAHLSSEDFVDAVHVLPSGRARYEPEVTRAVAAHLGKLLRPVSKSSSKGRGKA